MSGEYDLQVESGDMVFGPDDEPLFLAGTDVVAQDIQHRLLESGLVPEMVADAEDPAPTLDRMLIAVEDDERIRPGTARATVTGSGAVTVSAETMDGGSIQAQASA